MKWENITKASDAKALIPQLDETAQRTLKYLDGDYWQLARCWVGTRPPIDCEDFVGLLNGLERMFVPQPLSEECVQRHVDGVIGNEPAFEFVLSRSLTDEEEPAESEQLLLDETNAAVGEWWDERGGHEIAQEFTTQLVATGRACMRVFVPSGLLNEQSSLADSGDWKKALDSIYLECPAPESATVQTNRADMTEVSIFTFKADVEKNGRITQVDRVEISYLNDANETVIRILEDDVIIENGEAVQDIGGELYVDMATAKPLLSPATHRLQNALNVINSMILKNGDLAGFRERSYINLQPPKREVPDSTAPNGVRLVDAPLDVGADAANFFQGTTTTDKDGNERIAPGTIVITDPVDPAPLITAAERFEASFYKAVKQLFVLITGDAETSAVSRVQSRADFLSSLLKTKPKIERVLRSRLRCVLLLAAFLADDKTSLERFKKELRVRVDCRVDAGPLTPEERQALVTLYQANLVSRETTQIMLGIEDVDGEKNKLQDEQQTSQSYLIKQAEIVQAWTGAGASLPGAAAVAGVEKTAIPNLTRRDFVEDENGNQQEE